MDDGSLIRLPGRDLWSVRTGDFFVLLALIATSFSSAAFIPIPTSVRPLTPLFAVVALAAFTAGRHLVWSRLASDQAIRALAGFTAWCLVIAGVRAFSGDLPPLKGLSPLAGALKGILSLGLGVSVYACIRISIRDEERMRRGEIAIAVGMAASVALALVQFLAANGVDWALSVTLWITRVLTVQVDAAGYLADSRVWGLSLEPSWLASALGVALLPIAVTRAVCSGGVAAWSAAALAILGIGLTTSRGGLLLVASVILTACVWSCLPVARNLDRRRRIMSCLGLLLLTIAMAGLAARSDFVRRLVDSPTTSASAPVLGRVAHTGANFRVASWQAAWRTWQDHPIIGTGVGLAGWSMVDHYPAWSLQMQDRKEVLIAIDRSQGPLPNPKNFALRLLAESGLIGTALYLLFLWPHRPAWREACPSASLLPLLVLVAVLADWLTLDSFALAPGWIALGWAAIERQAAFASRTKP